MVDDDDDNVVIVPVPVPVPAPEIIPTDGCDVYGFGPAHAVAGNGNLLYGSDCTYQKHGCMPPMTCQHVGNCVWQCKT